MIFKKIKFISLSIFFVVNACNIGSSPTSAVTTLPVVASSIVEPTSTEYPNQVSTPTSVPTLLTPFPTPVPGIPDNLIIFAIDESISVPQNCSLSNARYDIPNLFVPLFEQYYDESLTGSSPQSKYSPWLEVVHWPLWNQDSQNSYDIQPTPASKLDYKNSRVTQKGLVNDAFFDELFTYFYNLPQISSSEKPTKRSLILFTDGSFQGETGLPSPDLQARASAILEEINNMEGVTLDLHIVLLCSQDKMYPSDYNWWVSNKHNYPDWFHLYEDQDQYSLIRSLWINAFRDKFYRQWDGYEQGIYLISNEGYWDLNSELDAPKNFDSCKTAEPRDRCIMFSFFSDATGLQGSAISSSNNLYAQTFIWQDDWYTKFPESRADSWYKLWDNKVIPINSCANDHSWIFNPGATISSPTLFWWRAASDLQLESVPENNIPVWVLYGDYGLEEKIVEMPIRVRTVTDFIPLNYMSPCYDVSLLIDGREVDTKKMTPETVSQGLIKWNIKDALFKIYPDISTNPRMDDLAPRVEVEVLKAHRFVLMPETYIDVRILYIPTFLSDKYQGGSTAEAFYGGDDKFVGVKYSIVFKYITDNFFPKNTDKFYRPFLYFVNGESGQMCSNKLTIPYENGGGIRILPPIGQSVLASEQVYDIAISGDFFDNDIAECSNIKLLRMKIVWEGWQTPDGVDRSYLKNWDCPVIKTPDAIPCVAYFGEK